jgi:hypothetical protein
MVSPVLARRLGRGSKANGSRRKTLRIVPQCNTAVFQANQITLTTTKHKRPKDHARRLEGPADPHFWLGLAMKSLFDTLNIVYGEEKKRGL